MTGMRIGAFVGWLVALSLVFASCDKDNGLENKELLGKDIPVRIRSFGVAEGGSENFTRASLQGESEVIATPVGDGMLLEMSVKEDESPLRKTELTDGAYFRVIAVKVGTTEYYSHGDFIYGNPISLLTDFHVKIGESYDYICFSYNETTNTLPSSAGYSVGVALPTSLNMSATKDPLWCKITGLGTVLSTGVELDITMKHLLAEVKVKVDCGYNGWKITGVAANKVAVVAVNPALSCAIDWKTGVISGTDMDQGLSYTISDATRTDQTSNEAAIIPKVSHAVIKIKATAISRNGFATDVPVAEKPITLGQALEGGVSYTITVRLRTPKWAGSNIYWKWYEDEDGDPDTHLNGGRLTFDEHYPNGDDAPNMGYQGVFFKWGSLVGISPLTSYSFWPVVNDPLSSSTWEIKGGVVPYFGSGYTDSSYERNNTYVIDDVRNDLATYQGFRGDICQYLSTKTGVVSGDYRLPMSEEFGHNDTELWTGRSDGWGNVYFFPLESDAYGTADMINSAARNQCHARNTVMGNVIFPASGWLAGIPLAGGYLAGSVYDVGMSGEYWSGSASGNNSAYDLYFHAARMSTAWSTSDRSHGFSVRCVLK
jgi:hypothetical protein